MFNILGSLVQFENELHKERCEEARKAALARGVRFGAKKKLTEKQVVEMREKQENGIMIKDLMKKYGLSKAFVYRMLSKMGTK